MRGAALATALLGTLLAGRAHAHQKSVSYSQWRVVEGGAVVEVRVRWLELTSLPATSLPDTPNERATVTEYLQAHLLLRSAAGPCSVISGTDVWLPAERGWIRVEWAVECDGEPTTLRSDLFGSLTNHVHLATVHGPSTVDVVLSPNAPSASVAGTETGSRPREIGAYVRLGVEHILSGWDHLAFLFLLIVVARRVGEVALLVTGFTVGHSVTLAAAALGVVVPNVRAVEATIAASILIVALENGGMPKVPGGRLVVLGTLALFGASAWLGGLPAFWGVALFTACYFALLRVLRDGDRLRWVIACLFGFVHGLGFSGVLLEQQLPRGELVSALFGFNIGVELGQLAVVLLVWPVLQWGRQRGLGERAIELTAVAGAALGVFALVTRAFG